MARYETVSLGVLAEIQMQIYFAKDPQNEAFRICASDELKL